jgi:hypothetical protein
MHVTGIALALPLLTYYFGRAIAQEVSHWLPATAARARDQVRSGGQSGGWVGILRILRFPLLILIPPTAPRSSSYIIRGWYNPEVNPNNIYKLSSYLTGNTCLRYKSQSVNAVYCENHTEHINTLRGQNVI